MQSQEFQCKKKIGLIFITSKHPIKVNTLGITDDATTPSPSNIDLKVKNKPAETCQNSENCPVKSQTLPSAAIGLGAITALS